MNSFLHRLLLIELAIGICLAGLCQDVTDLKLKDFKPVSIYKVPQTKVEKARYPVIDFHSHDYPTSAAEVDAWVKRWMN